MKLGVGLGLLFAFSARAADLKQATITAWDEYVRSATDRMQERLRPGNSFLKVDEKREWASRVKGGDILVLPSYSQGQTRVPDGLIHDWVSAAFLPDTTLDQVLAVVRNYDDYKEFYSPSVLDSTILLARGSTYNFSLILTNQSSLIKATLDTEYRCSFFEVSQRRWYSICDSTHIREIEDYGSPSQRVLSEGQGKGLIWRLFSISRFEERDGGVYVELEGIALSRDIPASLRWLIEPIVRRVSRNALVISLRQTEAAVRATEFGVSASVHNMGRAAESTGVVQRLRH